MHSGWVLDAALLTPSRLECLERVVKGRKGKSKRRIADGVFPGIYWKCSSWLNTCISRGISQEQDTQGSGFQGDLDL